MTPQNILSLPFRKATQIPLSDAIRQYISSKYDQHPDMFRHDLDVVDRLRRDAVNVREAHPSGIKKLQTYAGQLVWIGGKFPIDIGAEFTWYPAMGYNTERPLAQNNLKYELMNVLYNLASLYSQLAVSANRASTDGLKTAASWFTLAAGVLAHIKTTVLPELRMSSPPDDMDDATLESLTQLFLAQAQECFWQKAVMDGYKDASIAKLAARVSDLYNLAGDAAMKSQAVSSAWIHHMSAKHHHFAAAAQYRAACDCLEKRRYGEEVARLRDAVACVAEGLKETRGTYINKAVVQDLDGLRQRVEDDLKRAERDNDVIYLNVVPPKAELKILDRANMATIRTPPQVSNPYEYLGDGAEFGPALFTKLVPFAVHVAVSLYEERRDRLVNKNIMAELEKLTDELHTLLSSLNLPGSLQALEKPLGLPGSLVQHAEEIRQADALSRIQRGFADIDKLRTADRAIFEEGKALLVAEEEEDRRLRRRHGTERWTLAESRADPTPGGGAKLWNQAAEIDGYFASSTSSDGVVRDKFASVQDVLAILAGPDRGVMDSVPSSRRTEIPEALKPALGRLRSTYNDVLRLESRRRKRCDALRDKASRADDVKADILAEAARLERSYPTAAIVPAHFEDFFEARLDCMYEPDLEALGREAAEQERVLGEVRRASREFEAQRKRTSTSRGSDEREAALQRFDSAYHKYKEIVGNVEVGRKFYNDLSTVVTHFRDQAKTWVAQRRRDALGLEEEISMPPLSSLSINNPHSPPPTSYRNADSNAATNPAPHSPPAEARIQSWAGNITPRQPKPVSPAIPAGPGGPGTAGAQSVWSPGVGIKFAPPAGRDTRQRDNRQAAQQGENSGGPVHGTWEPSKGIRFG